MLFRISNYIFCNYIIKNCYMIYTYLGTFSQRIAHEPDKQHREHHGHKHVACYYTCRFRIPHHTHKLCFLLFHPCRPPILDPSVNREDLQLHPNCHNMSLQHSLHEIGNIFYDSCVLFTCNIPRSEWVNNKWFIFLFLQCHI